MPTSHRGLPPPAGMPLPAHSPTSNQSQMPDRWQHGSEETQRTFLQAKSDEERRRQEEERTRQESFRLEIRRTELEMLREAFRGGIPPHLVPIIFTGGGAFAGTSAEWANQYMSQLNHNQQQMLQGNIVSPPDSRLESRLLTATEHPTPKSGSLSSLTHTPAQPISSHVSPRPAQNLHHSTASTPNSYSTFGSGLPSTRNHTQLTHTADLPRSSLPRINTNDVHVQPPPQGPPPGLPMQLSGIPPPTQPLGQISASHQVSQQSNLQPQLPPESSRRAEGSPLFFHHWQPPSTQASYAPLASTSPASGKNMDSSLSSSQAYAAGSDSSHSPKKRKITSSSQAPQPSFAAAPPPGSQATSVASYSPGSNTKRRSINSTLNRPRSDSGSTRGYEPYPKNPPPRPRRSDAGGLAGDSSGSTSQFSISHMTSSDASPVMHLRESASNPHGNVLQESSIPHPPFEAGPESRPEHRTHKETESSTGHNATPARDF
ncbi:hypothetical protein Dda_8013 [Drechslerella dactyloides]|uniref:Uncharacterized protein n=1 Tax=Drechslerella dactyloides TaxID=74499 RepID=A0AAD6IRJ2_DREDA|nr:hypothetical protein Dda_8013 [Drechslerella dactyloides]